MLIGVGYCVVLRTGFFVALLLFPESTEVTGLMLVLFGFFLLVELFYCCRES